jgi:hypothetical protein
VVLVVELAVRIVMVLAGEEQKVDMEHFLFQIM